MAGIAAILGTTCLSHPVSVILVRPLQQAHANNSACGRACASPVLRTFDSSSLCSRSHERHGRLESYVLAAMPTDRYSVV